MKLNYQNLSSGAIMALMLLSSISASAEILSPEAALSRALASESRQGRKAPASDASSFRLTHSIGYDSAPGCYLFDNGERSIVVSAESEGPSLLGYFDTPADPSVEMPPAVKYWLEEYARQIDFVRANPSFVRKDTKAAPSQEVPILCETRWNQDKPYNNDCPKSGGKATYTGCVATAMAQILKYFNYPEHGVGTKTIGFGGQNLTFDFANTTFDWPNMLNRYWGGNYNDTQAAAVANLMYGCGVAVNMMYGTSSSGAYSVNIAEAFLNHFAVDKNIWFSRPEYYSAEEWDEIVFDNLKNVGPIVMDGRAPGGAHSFVCDGYNGNGYFHINWGWGGSYDGYFLLNALNPSGQGIGGYEGGYNADRDAILGISKPLSGPAKVHVANIDAFYPEKDTAFTGDPVYFRAIIKNLGYQDVNAIIGVNIYKNDALVSFIESGSFEFKAQGGINSFAVTIPQSLGDGDYKIVPAIKLDGVVKDLSTRSGYAGHSNMHISNGKITFEMPVNRDVAAIDVQFVGKPTVDAPVKIVGSIMNNTRKAYNIDLTLMLYTIDGQKTGIGDPLPITVLANTSTAFVYESELFSLSSNAEITPGKYLFSFYDEKSGNDLMDPIPVEILPFENAVETISVNNADHLEVYSLSGVKVAEGTTMPTDLAKGIYLIKTSNKIYKVIL